MKWNEWMKLNEWMNEWNEWVNEWINEWMNEWVNEWMIDCMNEGGKEGMHEWMNECMHACMKEWMNEWWQINDEWWMMTTFFETVSLFVFWFARPVALPRWILKIRSIDWRELSFLGRVKICADFLGFGSQATTLESVNGSWFRTCCFSCLPGMMFRNYQQLTCIRFKGLETINQISMNLSC